MSELLDKYQAFSMQNILAILKLYFRNCSILYVCLSDSERCAKCRINVSISIAIVGLSVIPKKNTRKYINGNEGVNVSAIRINLFCVQKMHTFYFP